MPKDPKQPTKSAWEHCKTRAKRAGGWSPWQDIVVAILATIIGYIVLDRKSARENAVIALVIGLGAGIAWQILKFIWRFLWSVPREMEAERDDAVAKLEVKTGMPPYHPKIVADRYGRQGNAYGLFIANDGYPAYQISIPDVLIGTSISRLTFSRTLARLIDKQGDQFFEAWIEDSNNTGRAGGALHEAMVDTNTDALTVGIIYNEGEYKDGEFIWYRSNCAIARDASVAEGLTVTFLSQELIPKPSTTKAAA